jgi:hypothetical protein
VCQVYSCFVKKVDTAWIFFPEVKVALLKHFVNRRDDAKGKAAFRYEAPVKANHLSEGRVPTGCFSSAAACNNSLQ